MSHFQSSIDIMGMNVQLSSFLALSNFNFLRWILFFSSSLPGSAQLQKEIRSRLKQIMMKVDLEDVTSKYVRQTHFAFNMPDTPCRLSATHPLWVVFKFPSREESYSLDKKFV